MKTILQTAAILPLLAASVLASTTLKCHTELGSKSVAHVPTVTDTVTNSIKPTVTKTLHSTSTTYVGYWYTITYFTTKTRTITDSAVTDTFSSTSTIFNVETDTITSTLTTTETNTVTVSSTSTTEVATTAGFRNIKDTINSDTLQRRALKNPHAPRAAPKAQGVLAYTNPVKVDCTKTVPNTHTSTVTKTGHPITKTVPYWAYKTTTTDTIRTTTTVVPPDVSATLTFSTTSDVTTFTTTFNTETDYVTTTSTSVISGPTVYDACNPNNVFGPNFSHGGQPYFASNVDNNGPDVGSDFLIVSDGASTALDCCYACQQFGTCETFIFRARNRNCFLLYHDGETCSSQSNHPNFILSKSGSDTGAGYAVGNGNCGYTYSGNSDGTVFTADQ